MEPIYHTCTDQRMAQSHIEGEIIRRLYALGVPVVPQVKLGQNWVFDGACNGTKLLIEIHGDYWHSDRTEVVERDERKQRWADDQGYRIVTIWQRAYEQTPEPLLLQAVELYWQLRRQAEAEALAEAALHAKHAAQRPRRSHYGDWRDPFLQAIEERGIIGDGLLAANTTYETVRRHRREDPAFEQAFQDARKVAADKLKAVYFDRAYKQSDRAMEYMLRLLDPDDAGGPNLVALLLPYLDLTKLTDGQIEQLSAGGDPVAIILGGLRPSGAGGT